VLAVVSVAIGDFNHDGNPDVATGNRSARFTDTPCTGMTYWDSVTILPGTGNGTFGPPATFRLSARNRGDGTYQNTQNALTSADLNGDGWTDLVGSPGAIVLSRPAVPNRPPQVSAGPDDTLDDDGGARLEATATDADNDWLLFEWRSAAGAPVGPGVTRPPLFCQALDPGTYTVTVTDGHGGEATDSMTVFPRRANEVFLEVNRPSVEEGVLSATPYSIEWASANLPGLSAFGVIASANNGKTWTPITECTSLPATATQCLWTAPGPLTDTARIQVEAFDAVGNRIDFEASASFRIVPRPTSLPQGWHDGDVGMTGAPGSAAYDGTTFTVRGSGADIWGTADEFHWAFTLVTGNFDLIARVTTVQNVSNWTKAGLMLRERSAAGARHASMFVTPSAEKGIVFQRRLTRDGTSVSTAGPKILAPVWLRLIRSGDDVSAYYKAAANGAWTLVATQTFAALATSLAVGLPVSSHVHGTLATGTFDNVQLISPAHLPPDWSEEDIGRVGAAGSATMMASAARVTGSGADIWYGADEFHWVFRRVTGDFSIEAFVESVEDVNRWTKAGLMIRTNSLAGAPHASLLATPTAEKGVVFQGRAANNGESAQISSLRVAPPGWLRLTRRGATINADYRETTITPWQHLGTVTADAVPETLEVGLAVSSHVHGALATARFTQIAVGP
jgi:hypothetical protein